ncbi:unnamed protein product [Rotaria sordida]|uniref:Vacuolar protein sorting-associated protein 53 homolog n=1 Tax=Rotaria sordida TaxID=392033 RepID=A0A813ZL94_9BILA|nr:unnamed protein product [Rotaria sordida]CAF3718037.1 unnamed protein product [Rotaria sordida]
MTTTSGTDVDDDAFDADDDRYDTLVLPSDVQKVIDQILPSTDEIDRVDFNPVDYINQLFPTEQSLANIDEVIGSVKSKIRSLDSDIRLTIRGHSDTEIDEHKALEEAQNSILLLFQQMREIKDKADKSEEMVKEITRDIKQLDVAKKNLTTSITTLNHLQMLIEGIDKIEVAIKKKSYGDIAYLLHPVISVLEHFQPYINIPQIQELSTNVKELTAQIIVQVRKECEDAFNGPNARNFTPNQHFSDVCKIIDVIDPRLRLEVINWFLKTHLSEYTILFQESQELAWLDKIDRRYAWLKRALVEYDEKYSRIFPVHWEMAERLTVEFCRITRRELANIMLKRKNEIDVKLLRFAIEKTVGFETIVEKRFQGNTLDHANNSITSHLNVKVINTNGNDDLNLTTNLKPKSSPFPGIISQCFEDHLDIYIAELDRSLSDQIQKFVDEHKKDGYPKFEGGEDTSNVLPTSADLFVYFRNCLVQCSKLSTGQPLLLLVQTFQKHLREYANRILTANLPKTNTTASSLVGTATIFIQNLPNIPSMLKEGETIAKLNESEICRSCSVLCTAEYCVETIQQLEDKMKEKITKSLIDKISFESERNIFKAIIAESIQILIQDLENACEPALTAMTKLSWQTIETVGDQSLYVTTIINHLKTIVPIIRNHLGSSRKYFIQFCTTFVDSFIKKFINHLYRCKPINMIGAEQLLLDTHSLKTVLLDLPSINLTVSRKPPQNFTKIVLKNMTRAEMILKVVLTPHDSPRQFVKNYLQLMNNDGDISSFQKILEMKGIRRPEQAHLIERLKKEHATIIASHQQQIQQQ